MLGFQENIDKEANDEHTENMQIEDVIISYIDFFYSPS
jgi:hypothetical protein